MKVETYELEEVTNEAQAMVADHEALELIEKLGLTGQKNISNKETATRMPYPRLTEDQHFVYSTLFPSRTPVENYSDGIIPIRVLQVISFLKENDFFSNLKIWHSSGRKDKDPVLIGYLKDKEHSWIEREYLIARWGDALLPLEDLMKQAKIIAFATLRDKVNEMRSKMVVLEAQMNMVKNPQDASIALLSMNPSIHGVQ